MIRRLKRLFNRAHRNKWAALSFLGVAADGVQQVLPYLPDAVPHAAVLGLTAFAIVASVISHFVQPEQEHA